MGRNVKMCLRTENGGRKKEEMSLQVRTCQAGRRYSAVFREMFVALLIKNLFIDQIIVHCQRSTCFTYFIKGYKSLFLSVVNAVFRYSADLDEDWSYWFRC